MTIWIVLRNGEVDEVFDNEIVAHQHKKALAAKWALAKVIEKEVKAL